MKAKVLGIFLLLTAICGYLAWMTPESFLMGNNIENLLRRTSMYGILGIGVAFVIITGGIDLSIGSLVCLVGCTLAIFLDVQYQPFGVAEVVQVRGEQREILLSGSREAFRPGDRVRYYGGRRARNAIATVVKADQVRTEGGATRTRLVVDQPLSRDDEAGLVVRLANVLSFQDGGDDAPSEVVIQGAWSELRPRDQIWFVNPAGGLKQLPIVAVESNAGNDRARLTINGRLAGFDTTWLAAPLERRQRFSIPVAVGLVMGMALLFGALHGWLVTQLKLQPFVVTLCGLLFYRGVSRWMVSDATMGFGNEYENSLSLLGTGKLQLWAAADGSDSFGLPYPFFVLLIVAALAALVLNRTIWGRYMLALGYNEQAARYSGINTQRMTLLAYVICSGLAALGGLLFALDSNSVAPSSFGNFFELYAIAAAVLGGCSLRGGEGGILGVVIGAAVMQTLYNLIVLLKISDKLEFAIIGAVILLGVIADEVIRRIAAKRRAKRAGTT